MNRCYLCGEADWRRRPGRVRDCDTLEVLECQFCGLVCLSSFDHITADFYENSQMNGEDANIERWANESVPDDERRFSTLRRLIINKKIMDFGCGAGGFLARAGSVAELAVGVEPEKRLKPYFRAKQLTVYNNLNEVRDTFDLITLFHVLEHLPDPVAILERLLEKLNPDGSLIVEVPNANDALLSLYQSDDFARFTYWRCHLFLFNADTLGRIARKAGYKINYIKQIQRYPVANHLYWLAKHQPGGHIMWNFFDSPELNAAYEKALGLIGCCDTLTASFGRAT